MTNTKELIEELRVQANQHPCDADLTQFDIAATALEQLQARCEELERENFALSAFQCHSGKSDAGGNMRCDFQDEIERLKRERDCMAASISHIKQCASECSGNEPSISALYRAIEEAPQQSLAEHDAEVARKAITKAKETFVLRSNGNEDFQAGIDYCVDAYDKHLDQYAQRIKDGEL